jgi:hypothetical protein
MKTFYVSILLQKKVFKYRDKDLKSKSLLRFVSKLLRKKACYISTEFHRILCYTNFLLVIDTSCDMTSDCY